MSEIDIETIKGLDPDKVYLFSGKMAPPEVHELQKLLGRYCIKAIITNSKLELSVSEIETTGTEELKNFILNTVNEEMKKKGLGIAELSHRPDDAKPGEKGPGPFLPQVVFQQVESSIVESIGYYCGDLYVRFKNFRLHRYKDIPADVHEAFLVAISKGAFFNVSIKEAYKYDRVEFSSICMSCEKEGCTCLREPGRELPLLYSCAGYTQKEKKKDD